MHEFFFENLRNPARSRRAGLMRQFRSGQLDSIRIQLAKLVQEHNQKELLRKDSAKQQHGGGAELS